ncbi:hypothetical protein O1W17_30980, partial [Streptomyces sp. H34-S5]|nr:hypothetical protein [Streptomyces sp. H34-S5]
MGLFGRRRRERARERAAQGTGPAGGATNVPGPAATPVPADGGWAAAAPVQRVLGVPRLTADRNFPTSLATRQSLALSGGMGHAVAPSAPSGLLLDALVPVPRRPGPAPAPSPLSPHLQRLPLAGTPPHP